ncbi:MAG TPA: SGNH/GDSL hydrolase family protein [Solirubrobacteraceae bacterium]|nr:SGNH/GDSL hydrolase family protein [Solirubrobacteraceae bacterium]
MLPAAHGFPDSILSRRHPALGRPLALVLGLVALAVFAFPAPAANARPAAPVSTYLALGDSISFGYSEQVFNENFPNESPSFFEEGFTNDFAQDLSRPSAAGRGVTLVNDACPGETSNGLIGEKEALGGKTSTEPAGHNPQGLGDYHPCAYSNVDGLPLHNSLSVGGQSISQLEDALSILKEGHPAHPVDAITLNIGSNDELAAIKQCEIEVTEEFTHTGKSKYGATPAAAVIACIAVSSEKITVPHILANIGDILGVLDNAGPGGGHYTGPIVLVGFYNPDALVLPGSDALQEGLNAAVEADILPHFPNVTFANPFPVFNKGQTPAKEQASICKYTEMCNPNDPGGSSDDGDIHPSPTGYRELGRLVNQAYLANPAR